MTTEPLVGNFVRLRIAEEADAEFTLAIRQEGANTEHMPRLTVNMEQQRAWLKAQKESKDCYFFVVERLNGERIGTFSLYNIRGSEAETGRLILQGNPMETVETCVLFHDFVFGKAGLTYVYSEMEADNMPAMGLSNRFGGEKEREFYNEKTGKRMCKMRATKEAYTAKSVQLKKLLARYAGRA